MRAWPAAVVVAVAVVLAGCSSKEAGVPVPATLSDEPDAALKATHRADEVFTLRQPDGTYKALVFKLPKASDADSDYRVVFYREQGSTFVRHGAEHNLVDFERPRWSAGLPARIETTLNRLGVRYHFVVDAKGAEMVPTEGEDGEGGLVGHPAGR